MTMKLYGFWRSLATYRVRVALALKIDGNGVFFPSPLVGKGRRVLRYFGRIASGVSGCIDGCALANSGRAIAVS